jgi:hypothetical protein
MKKKVCILEVIRKLSPILQITNNKAIDLKQKKVELFHSKNPIPLQLIKGL